MSWDYYWANDPTHFPFKSSTWNCSDRVDDELPCWIKFINDAIKQKLKNEKEDDTMPLRYKKMCGKRVTEETIQAITHKLKNSNVEAFEWDMRSKQLFIRYDGDIHVFDFGEYINITKNNVTSCSEVFYDVYPARVAIDGEIFQKIYLAPNVEEFHLTSNSIGKSRISIKDKGGNEFECKFENAIFVFDDYGQFIQLIDRDKDSPFGNVHQALLKNGYEKVELL